MVAAWGRFLRGQPAASRQAWLMLAASWLVLAGVCILTCALAFGGLLSAPSRPELATSGGRIAFADDAKTRTVFGAIALAEHETTRRGIKRFPDHPWAQHDDRAGALAPRMRQIAELYGFTLTETYLLLEHGLREKWPGVGGKPLDPEIRPMDIRQR